MEKYNLKKNGVFFQIGANDGNDIFKGLVNKYKPSKVILVEPNKELIGSLRRNYKNIPNVNIINKAINTENKDVVLYLPAMHKKRGNKGENGISYTLGNISMIPMNDWGSKDNMIEIKAKGITFNDLCKQMKITHIDYLQIDTEGFDSEIIQSIDIEEKRFGFEPEITSKVSKLGFKIKEVPISYYPRTNKEGKKIGFKDGLRAIYCILKYR